MSATMTSIIVVVSATAFTFELTLLPLILSLFPLSLLLVIRVSLPALHLVADNRAA
jgi:hypothetical protein